MLEPAASGVDSCWVDGTRSLFDVLDSPIVIDHECGTIGKTVGEKNSVVFGNRAVVIAEQREGCFQLACPMFQRGQCVGANCKNLNIGALKFIDTRLVCGEFLRSTTGESGRKERQNDRLLAAEIRQLDRIALGGR